MCSGSEAGSYLRLIDFVDHSTLGLRVIKKKKKYTLPYRTTLEQEGYTLKALKGLYLKPRPESGPDSKQSEFTLPYLTTTVFDHAIIPGTARYPRAGDTLYFFFFFITLKPRVG